MSERMVVGVVPWLPRPLSLSKWWTEPVRAERLAAFRIGLAAVLLVDVLGTYLPQCADFFGTGSLCSPEVFGGRNGPGHLRWTLLRGLTDTDSLRAVLLLWAGAAGCLLLGVLPRLSAAVAWALAISVYNLTYYLHNSGDNVRSIGLFYLIFCPSAAAWSLTSWWRSRGRQPVPAYVAPWPLRLLFLQLVLIYWLNGIYKLGGGGWRGGEVMHGVMTNLAWSRMAYAQVPLPDELMPVLTYVVLCWELFFPLFMLIPSLRTPALWLGVFFHVGTAVHLQLVMFPFYMLCLYLPLVPWERYVDRWRPVRAV